LASGAGLRTPGAPEAQPVASGSNQAPACSNWRRVKSLGSDSWLMPRILARQPGLQSFSVSPARGCHFISRFSTRPTTPSSSSAKPVSTTMPAITVLMSKVPSACRMR